MSLTHEIDFTLNGVQRRATVGVEMSALQMLREVVGLTGTKYGCGEGECGACTILVDGLSVNSCLLFAVDCDGREHHDRRGSGRRPAGAGAARGLRRARRGAVRLLHAGHDGAGDPPARHATAPRRRGGASARIEGNLCRCTGYQKIVEAIVEAGATLAGRRRDMNETLTRPTSTASLIGQRIPKMDAPEKASGKTRYIHDIDLPGQLHAAILRSARVHARILRIDTSGGARAAGRALRCSPPPTCPTSGRSASPRTTCRSSATACAASATRSPPWPPTAKRSPLAALKLIEVEYEDLPDRRRRRGRARARRGAGAPADRTAPRRGRAQVGAWRGKADNVAMSFDYGHGDVAAGRGRVRRRRRGRLRTALRDALLHGRLGRDRRVRRQGQPAAVLEHAGALPAQARVRRDPRHGPGAHPHHPAADRRRLRLQARHLSVRDHLRLPRARHRAAGEAGVHAAKRSSSPRRRASRCC